MSMKRWNFSNLAIGCILLFTVDVKAEGPVEYSAVESSSRGINTGDYMVNLLSPEMPVTLESPIVYDKPQKTIYQRRTEGYKSFWNKIIPRYAKVQFAGGLGVVSWGVGCGYGKKRQW